jgi:pyruvate-formate lyase-activating enzyme
MTQVEVAPANRVEETLFELAAEGFRQSDKAAFLAAADAAQRLLVGELTRPYGDGLRGRLLALRLVNLLVARYHFHHRHTVPAARPIQLMIDPVNNCHLHCPGCLHTANPRFAGSFDWPGGALAPATQKRILAELGPTAWGVVYYNWGEPLLGKKTPELVREAKRYRLHTCLSTNLSVPFDADALVGSGLNFLFLSIDGATQATYARFRRGGDLALCLANIEKLVEARRRLGSPTPFLLWRYLTFEHNLHEVEEAWRLARELGVDQFSVTTPFAVEWDDPEIRAATSPFEGAHPLRTDASFRECARPWCERAGGVLAEPSRPASATCWWLYQNLTFDARARIFPCCMAPERDAHKVYGQLPAAAGEAFNVRDLRLSRLSFADTGSFRSAHEEAGGGTPPYCAVCWEKPELTYTLGRDVARDLRLAEPMRLVGPEAVRMLTEWPISR